MKLTNDQLQAVVREAVRGMARLQARQEAMECVIRALMVESPPAHPLFWQALNTAQSDLSQRTASARSENMPEFDADALALLNVLRAACAPPEDSGT